MKNKLLIVFLTILFSNYSIAQSRFWNKISENELLVLEKLERVSIPSKYKLFSFNLEGFKQQISTAPLDSSGSDSNVIINFPNSKGEILNYKVYESPIMDEELSNKYPNIKSYTAVGVDDITSNIRFSVTLFGLHAMSLSGNDGTFYIDTYTKDLNNYIVYNRNDIQNSSAFSCMVEDDHEDIVNDLQLNKVLLSNDGLFRTYRLAMACTIEYAAFHVNAAGLSAGTLSQKKGAVLAAMNVTMTRINGLYERDMSIRMSLIPNNDLIIFIDSDSFNNTSASTLINQSQTVIDATVGFSSYDIGHTVSTGGGGLAQLNSPCTNNKARGITGLSSPVGDPFDIDYVAHEMGHQFGATHTFNNSCGGNRTSSTAVEPGSGTTIMAYAGICAPNIQNNSDAHFHVVSLNQMVNFVNGNGNCATFISNNNSAPVINAGLNYTIPFGTAFILKGTATDVDGDALTYCWEQTNNQISTQPPLQINTTGPNFRSVPPSSSPNRFMPNFSEVLQDNLYPTWEVVSDVARTMNFALVVRDNRMPNGGQTERDDMVLTVANAGPFVITSPASSVSWVTASSQTVSWNVAGTTTNGINTSNVNILLTTDEGITFTTLLANTPNDGSQIVVIPNTPHPNCRIMVEPVGNIYYAISSGFSIVPSLNTENFDLTNLSIYPNPNNGNFTVAFDSQSDKNVVIEVHDISGRKVYSKNYPKAGVFIQELQLEKKASGIYLVTVDNGNAKIVKKIVID
jgi:hypothetical protein